MKIVKVITNVIAGLFFVILCILIYSEKWFLSTWDSSIDFSTVVYQIFSPLKGTGKEMILEYVRNCIFPPLIIVGILVLTYAVFYSIRKKLSFSWKVRIGKRCICLCSGSRWESVCKYIGVILVLCAYMPGNWQA